MDTTSRPHRLLLLTATAATLLLAGLGLRWLIAPDTSVLPRLVPPPPLFDLFGPTPMHAVQLVVALIGAGIGTALLAATRGRGQPGRAGSSGAAAPGAGLPTAATTGLLGVGLTQVAVFGLGFASLATLSAVGYLLALLMPLGVAAIAVMLLRRGSRAGRTVGAAVLTLLAAGLLLGRDLLGRLAAEMGPTLVGMADQLLVLGLLVLVGTVWAALVAFAIRSVGGPGLRRVEAWVVRHRRPLTLLAACGPLPYALTRLTWLTPWPLLGGAMAEADPATRVWGMALSTGAWLGVILTLGLIRPWGEVVPGWFPLIGERPVPPAAVAVPGVTVAALLTFAAVPVVLSASSFGTASMLLFALVFPCWLWGPALGLAVWGYLGHRRAADRPRVDADPSARMGA